MSLYDFYMYLKYIEFSAENLEFYLWFKNYEAAYAKGLVINDDVKNYGSIGSAAESMDSVAPIQPPQRNTPVIPNDKVDIPSDKEDRNDSDSDHDLELGSCFFFF